MRTITLLWEDWPAIIAVLREKRLPHLLEQLEQHPPDQATVSLTLTEDLFLRSFNWARWQLGIPLPVE